ncbi:hypothetical protein A2996_00535 [Candidatus Campbellbacteria bacterium RIFCSPLOWO2_01_FULL_34_15]|uniref:Uncharacterized protein n=2 Tax=Candidatus Campbelliibacteriota TaxID=1752727 RepID=A0A1F5EL46_9BACT|nr:MAG: hypothetical protein A2996_00535 [Candidatus Campbellbacteria bacterium RIFCSPLOWO2_01_FULL_34_15]OGD68379.1 MAG: hypothetical protein A2811_01535 [Candidatus Campbellbacteria bacterium RIFCSPHIGHO2_01_FULL_34_10]
MAFYNVFPEKSAKALFVGTRKPERYASLYLLCKYKASTARRGREKFSSENLFVTESLWEQNLKIRPKADF